MSCATAPVFWAPQQRLPLPLQRFLRVRLEAALQEPTRRSLLVWPTVLGSPTLRDRFPEGISEAELFAQAGRMLAALGVNDPAQAWQEVLAAHPDTADRGPKGWLPQRIWDPLASAISLRCGVILLALTGQPEDGRYRFSAAVTLFNSALFHECHDSLESLWQDATGDLKRGLQGLILMAAGFYHQQQQDALGMISLWKDAQAALDGFEGELATPWGRVEFSQSLASMEKRILWVRGLDTEDRLDGLWEMPRPEWELK